jgi:hypothetical protein
MAGPSHSIVSNDFPADWAAAVTPSDTVDFDQRPRALYVGSSGNITVNMADGQAVTFANVPAGMILPVRPKRVLATGTTASNIVALF